MKMMKRKGIAAALAVVIAGLVVVVVASRSHAVRVADTAMQELVARGWHIDSVRFLPAVNGPFWVMTYQHDDYPSCFPFHVSVSVVGKTFHQPTPESIEKVVAAHRKQTGEAEQPAAQLQSEGAPSD